MAESTAKIADSTREVEKKPESVPEGVPESSPASAPVAEEPKSEVLKAELIEPKEVVKIDEPAASAVSETSAPVEEAAVVPNEKLNDGKVETADPPADEETVPETVVESKAVDAPVTKMDHPTLFQKVKKAFEFPRSHKTKDSPVKEVPSKETEASVEAVPLPEAETAAPASAVAAEPAVEVAPPAAAIPEAKATVSEKVSEKVSDGKGFFNKVKKSFFTKSHSFSGSIPDSKLGATPGTPPPAIAEVPKEAESAPPSVPVAAETPAPASAEPAVGATPTPVATDLSAASEATPTPAPPAETVAPAAEESKEATRETVQEKAVVKEDKPKNKFFQKIVRRLLPKTSQNSPPSAAPAAAPVVAASA